MSPVCAAISSVLSLERQHAGSVCLSVDIMGQGNLGFKMDVGHGSWKQSPASAERRGRYIQYILDRLFATGLQASRVTDA